MKITDAAKHRLWAELSGDSAIESLKITTAGWVPRKRERVCGITSRHALSILLRGGGTYLPSGARQPEKVTAPGIFFTAPGIRQDYGPVKGSCWEEIYWIVDGERVAEWERAGWWPGEARYAALQSEQAALWRGLFDDTVQALERRDRHALDLVKLSLEQCLCRHFSQGFTPLTALEKVEAMWRREPWRSWSQREAAASAGMSYTLFRQRFTERHGQTPYQHLRQLRLDLAASWLRGTDEPVKSVAIRCGFGTVESFIRAFHQAHGATPAVWREEKTSEQETG
jgi:AraC-like DNA-binding protein